MKNNMVSEALGILSLHALDFQRTAKEIGDREAEFVWHEVRAMLRSMEMLKRSPLLDEINARISSKPNEATYYLARLSAAAAVFMLMKAQSWSRARACKTVGRLTGVDAVILEKKMGIPADPSDWALIAEWEHWPDVYSALEAAKHYAAHELGREPTRKEWFRSIIRLSKSNVQSTEHIEWRRQMLGKAFHVRLRKDTRDTLTWVCSKDMIDRMFEDRVLIEAEP